MIAAQLRDFLQPPEEIVRWDIHQGRAALCRHDAPVGRKKRPVNAAPSPPLHLSRLRRHVSRQTLSLYPTPSCVPILAHLSRRQRLPPEHRRQHLWVPVPPPFGANPSAVRTAPIWRSDISSTLAVRDHADTSKRMQAPKRESLTPGDIWTRAMVSVGELRGLEYRLVYPPALEKRQFVVCKRVKNELGASLKLASCSNRQICPEGVEPSTSAFGGLFTLRGIPNERTCKTQLGKTGF